MFFNFFKKKEKVQINVGDEFSRFTEKYHPWDETKDKTAKILDIKEGWVKYKIEDRSLPFVTTIINFLDSFKKIGER